MATDQQLDYSEWQQDEHAAAIFRADHLSWTGCQPAKDSTAAWSGKETVSAGYGHNIIPLLGGAEWSIGRSRADCSRMLFAHQLEPPPIVAVILRSETERLREKFSGLVTWWRNDTRFSSSSDEKILHPAYQSIMTMGSPAVPLILEELKTSRGHWFWALRFMTGIDLVPEGANVNEAREAWLSWGRREGILR